VDTHPAAILLPILAIGVVGLVMADQKGLLGSGSNLPVMAKCMHNRSSKGVYWMNIDEGAYASASSIQRGDEVVVRPLGTNEVNHALTRVVGLPGEHVVVQGTQVWIDGVELPHARIKHSTEGFPSFMENLGTGRFKVSYSMRAPHPAHDVVMGSDEVFLLPDERMPGLCRDSYGRMPFSRIAGPS
jgi:hypothetical protein